jgi:glycosyltransferase involved in cell wall biosynthesis
MGMKAALMAFQLIQRNIQILSVEVPKTDIAHSSIAWLPALIAICAKMENGCPIIVSEDGAAFRELLLQYNNYSFDEPSKTFWRSFALNVVRTIYYAADVITPVCHTNAIWAKNLGADPSKIRVIYNGVNTKRFRPIDVAREDNRPTVVCVARVEIVKDIVGLIQAIRYVKKHIPNIQCLIFGSSTDLEYSIRCVNMVRKLHLDDNVRFMGSTKEPEKAYNIGDIVAFSSITEGLPFAVLEAMACGKAVVASNVGGVREVLECSGLLVRSRRPSELAKGIITLLKDEKLRYDLGVAASKRVNSDFTIEKSIAQFRQLYENLAVSDETRSYAGLKTEAIVR